MLSPFSVIKFRLLFIACWCVWIVLHAAVLYWFQYPAKAAMVDSLISNAWLASVCLLVNNTFRYYLPQKGRYTYMLAFCAIMTLLWAIASKSMLMMLLKTSAEYASFFSQSLPVRMAIAFLIIGCMILLSVLWYTLQDRQAIERRNTETEKLAREAELYNLRQQLQPHFLFNSLNSINALIGFKPNEARNMIQQLSDFLRGTLRKEESQWNSLKEELSHLQLYLNIEKVRFGHRLDVEVLIDEAALEMKIPGLLLQPIVENAIKFGLYDTTEAITIRINAKVENEILVIAVENPFDKETTVPKKGTGFGLSSVQRRLYLLYAQHDLLSIHTTDNIFTTTISIPQ